MGERSPIALTILNSTMKLLTRLLIVTILASSSFMHSQDTIKIDEVVISKEIKIKKLLNKIKSNLIKNCDTTNYNFHFSQKSYINNNTLMVVDENIKLKINSFTNKFHRQYFDSLRNKLLKIDENRFQNYIKDSSPLRWVSDYPIKKNLNIVNLDFFKNYKNHDYSLDKINDEKSEIRFTSDSLYQGKIIFNSKTLLPITIEYFSLFPYEFSHTSVKNLSSTNQFESKWIYSQEKALINFDILNGKIAVKNIMIEEELENFEYNILNKNGESIFRDKNNFSTKIELLKVD